MHRLLVLFACLAVFLSLGMGSVAHAMEPIACIDTGAAAQIGHADGDSDQVPADADKDYPHHHGGCHGHHVAATLATAAPIAHNAGGALIRPRETLALMASLLAPALRPPRT